MKKSKKSDKPLIGISEKHKKETALSCFSYESQQEMGVLFFV